MASTSNVTLRNPWDLIYIGDKELISTVCHVPLHIVSTIFLTLVLISIKRNENIQPRPKTLFLVNCGMYWICSIYVLSSDVVFFIIWRETISIQTCSILRNFVQNPLALQTFPEALDKYLVFANIHTLSISSIVIFNIFALLLGIFVSAYNTFLQDVYSNFDDVCPLIRNNQWSNFLLFFVSWLFIMISAGLIFATYRKCKEYVEHARSTIPSSCMTEDRYYRDRDVLRVFLIMAVWPIVTLLLPAVVLVAERTLGILWPEYFHIGVWLIAESGIPVAWLIQILYVSQLKNGFIGMFRPRAIHQPSTMEPSSI